MAATPLEFILKVRDEASASMERFRRSAESVASEFSKTNSIVTGAIGALSAYAGAQGLKAIITASDEARDTLAQARFFLNTFGGSVDANLATLQKWASGVQRATGIGDEYAVLVAAKLNTRIKDMNKAMNFSNTLLRLQRLGLANASDTANVLLRATEGNSRALRFLAEQLGITVPEFVSLETIMAEIEKRLQGTEAQLGPFGQAWIKLSETFNEIKEKAGAPIAQFLASMLKGINDLITQFPILQDMMAGGLIFISTLLTTLGIAKFFSFILPAAIAGTVSTIGLVIGVFIAFAAATFFVIQKLQEMGISMRTISIGAGVLFGAIAIIAAAFGAIPIAIAAALAAIIILAVEFSPQISAIFNTAWNFIKTLTEGEWNIILATIVSILSTILLFVGGWVPALIGLILFLVFAIAKHWEAIREFTKLAWEAIAKFITSVWQGLTVEIPLMAQEIVTNIGEKWENAKTIFFTVWNGIKTFFLGVWDEMRNKAESVVNFIVDRVNQAKQLLTEAQETARRAVEVVTTPIRGAVSGVMSGISNLFGGKRQMGGGVEPGKSFLVGERGPELFMPSTRGRILPDGSVGAITLMITGNTFMSDEQAALHIGDMIVNRLKLVTKIGV